MYVFDSKIQLIQHPVPEISELLIPHEEMIVKGDRKFALENGGVITRNLIQHLPLDWQNHEIVVDTRVHMLMKGMFPCVPGWHHDYVARTAPGGQPNYDNFGYRSEHLMLLVNAEVAPTQFAIGEAEYDPVPLGTNVYQQWHKETNYHLSSGKLVAVDAPSNQWLLFNDLTMHQGVQAKWSGWRYFIRVSRFFINVEKFTHTEGEDRIYLQPPEIFNQNRKQVQVYMSDPTMGW